VPLAFEFPPTSAEWTFFVAAAVILLGPLLVERVGLPGIVGVILGGLLVGPFVLDWLPREGAVESLGDLGILMLMFLAGLELDLDEFQVNRRGALTFGAFTFTLPFVLGIAVAAAHGYGTATALLFGSLWASHTLVAYPIVQEHGLLRDRAVGIGGGGTVMTDTLALSVLAVVAGSVASDSRPAILLLEFAGVGQHRGARFLWVLVALTGAALVADRGGIEGIVGAFFAGLALNRLVPARSRLMGQIEFVGGVLLIPFFLLSTGMLIDPEKFTERRVLGLAALSLAVVIVGKGVAAYVSARILKLSRAQGQLLFGLSLAQAAATLAAVTIGVEIGVFDTDLLNATLVVVLVSVLASSILTRAAARKIEQPAVEGERLAEHVFVPIDEVDDPAITRLAARLAMGKGGTVLVGALAAASGAELAAARARARSAEQAASAVGAAASSVVRVDTSGASALAAIAAEYDVSLVVTGWRRAALAADVVLGGQNVDLVALADVPVLAVLTARDDYRRVVLALDRGDLQGAHASQLELAIAVTSVAAAGARGRVLAIVPDDEAARRLLAALGDDAEAVVDARSRLDAVAALAREDDLVLVPGRAGGVPMHRDAFEIAALPLACSVAVPTRPHAATALVTGSSTLVGSRSG
jgi:Kef-type K+ transport system membrane component KefB